MMVDFPRQASGFVTMRSTHRTVRVQSGCIDADAWRFYGHDQPGAVFDEL
jgi:hypothetical protein